VGKTIPHRVLDSASQTCIMPNTALALRTDNTEGHVTGSRDEWDRPCTVSYVTDVDRLTASNVLE